MVFIVLLLSQRRETCWITLFGSSKPSWPWGRRRGRWRGWWGRSSWRCPSPTRCPPRAWTQWTPGDKIEVLAGQFEFEFLFAQFFGQFEHLQIFPSTSKLEQGPTLWWLKNEIKISQKSTYVIYVTSWVAPAPWLPLPPEAYLVDISPSPAHWKESRLLKEPFFLLLILTFLTQRLLMIRIVHDC